MTRKLLLALPKSSPSGQLTVAAEVPAFVLEPTFQVHDTLPVDPATGLVFNPAAVETVPEA